MKTIDPLEKPKLSERVCPRCKFENTVDSLYCKRCGCALDVAESMHSLTLEETEKKIVDDPRFLAIVKKAVAEAEKSNE